MAESERTFLNPQLIASTAAFSALSAESAREQQQKQLLKVAQKEIKRIRTDKQINTLLLGSFAIPLLGGIAGSIPPSTGETNLEKRRRDIAYSGAASAASSSFTGGLIGLGAAGLIPATSSLAAFAPTLGPIGAGIGLLIGSISAISQAMKEWNNILPDLEANINKIKDTTARTIAVGDELTQLIELLKNPELKITDKQKINNRIQQLLIQNTGFQGVDLTTTGVKERAGVLTRRQNVEELNNSLEEIIQRGVKDRTAFTVERGSGIVSREFANSIIQNILERTNTHGQDIISFLSKIENIESKKIFESGNVDLITKNLQNIFRQAGIPGAAGINKALSGLNQTNIPESILPQILTFLGIKSRQSGTFLEKEKDKFNLFDTEKNLVQEFNNQIKEAITRIQEFSNSIEIANKNTIAQAESDARIFEIRERGFLERQKEGLSPTKILRDESKIEEELIRRRFETSRRSNLNQLTGPLSTFGFKRLEDLQDAVFKGGLGLPGTEELKSNIISFRRVFEDIIKDVQSGKLESEDVKSAVGFGKRIFESELTTNNTVLRDELQSVLNLLSKTIGENNFLTEEEIRTLKEHIEKLDENTETLERTSTFRGNIARFVTGQLSRNQLTGNLLDISQAQTREFGFQPEQGFRNAIGLARAELSYNRTTFFDDIQIGAVDAARTFRTEFAQAFKDFAKGTKDAKEAFTDFALSVAYNIQDKIIDIGINSLLGSLFGLGGTQLQGIVKAGKFSTGGLVTGGSGIKDDVPAVLSSGEYVVKKDAVDKYGEEFFTTLNNSANIRLANRYDYNNPKFPTSGGQVFSPFLTAFAFEDENNPQNRLRNERESALISYLSDFAAYNTNKSQALRAFRKQKRNQLIGTYISAALGAAGPLLSRIGNGSPNVGFNPSTGSTYSYGIGTGGYKVGVPGLPGFARGGPIDNVPVMLTAGEYVLNRSAVNHVGAGFLNNINAGRYASGGIIGSSNTDINRDMTELISKLIDSNEQLNKNITLLNQNKSPINQTQLQTQNNLLTPTIISNVTVNMNNDGTGNVDAKTTTRGQTKEDDREKSKQLSEAIRAVVINEIISQSRIGGLLRQNN